MEPILKSKWRSLLLAAVLFACGLAGTGLQLAREAGAVGIMQMQGLSGVRSYTWADWDGTETPWSYDADTYSYRCIAQGALAADETGQGYVSGPDRILTAISMPGTVGGYRALDGASSKFTMTLGLSNLLTGVNNWCIVIDARNWVVGASTTSLLYIGDAGGNNTIRIYRANADVNKITFQVTIGGAAKLSAVATDSLGSTGAYWFVIGRGATLGYFGGFMASGEGSGVVGQPTKWTDLPNAQRVNNTAGAAVYAANVFDTTRMIGSDGGTFAQVGWGKIVMSRTTLIDELN